MRCAQERVHRGKSRTQEGREIRFDRRGIGGELRRLSMHFSDVENFSTISEGMQPTELVVAMGRYFELMSGALTRHGATIDKFMGDGIMAFFNAPEELPGHQRQACLAAREAQRKADEDALDKKITMLRAKSVAIAARATEKGGLFKSIVAKDVAKAILAQHSLEIPEDAISFSEPVKTVGEHRAHLKGPSAKADISVNVAAA